MEVDSHLYIKIILLLFYLFFSLRCRFCSWRGKPVANISSLQLTALCSLAAWRRARYYVTTRWRRNEHHRSKGTPQRAIPAFILFKILPYALTLLFKFMYFILMSVNGKIICLCFVCVFFVFCVCFFGVRHLFVFVVLNGYERKMMNY